MFGVHCSKSASEKWEMAPNLQLPMGSDAVYACVVLDAMHPDIRGCTNKVRGMNRR
jgi:hypothetical protein